MLLLGPQFAPAPAPARPPQKTCAVTCPRRPRSALLGLAFLRPSVVDVADLVPLTVERLLPERDLVVPRGHGEKVARDRPAHTPNRRVEGLAQPGRLPRPAGFSLGPYQDGAVLRAAGDHVARNARARRPRDVPHPVFVRRVLLPQRRRRPPCLAPLPDPHVIVARARHKFQRRHATGGRVRERRDRRPADRVAAEAATVVHWLGQPRVVVLVRQHRHPAVRRRAAQNEPVLVRSPGN
mmetsp:Transcript_9527/g.22538  ORF Transcript_9527/g.22538 Transcript_9527/m.22538 type:complete len:238 (+) Transcript_9527:52-765(+)